MFNYVVTAHKPSSVTHSVTVLEINKITAEGVEPMMEVPIYGRICALQLFRPDNAKQDYLFVATERYTVCILRYDTEMQEIATEHFGDVQDRIGRPTENKQVALIDSKCRAIVMHLYEGLLKIIPFEKDSKLKEAFNVRLEDASTIVDLKLLDGTKKKTATGDAPVVALIFQDNKNARHLRTFSVAFKEKDLQDGPFSRADIGAGANMLIPVAMPLGGVIILSEQSITYHDGVNFQTTSMPQPASIVAYGKIDTTRWLMGDSEGNLYLLGLKENDKGHVPTVEFIGQTCIASTISYLDAGFVYIGSCYGDAQLIRLNSQKVNDSFIELIGTYTNIGPIVDFSVIDVEKQGQGQIVACSGAMKDGSIRIIRNGIGIEEQARLDMEGVKGMWSIKKSLDSDTQAFVIISFIGASRALSMDSEGELGESELAGLATNALTIECANVKNDNFIQVTENSVRLVSLKSLNLVAEWKPKGSIKLASINPSQVLVSLGEGKLVYLEFDASSFKEVSNTKLDYEVSCVNINPLGSDLVTNRAAVGMWNEISVRILELPSLKLVTKEELGGEILPRSVLFCTLDKLNYMLTATGDGHLYSFKLTGDTLSDKKKVSLGTKPIALSLFKSKGNNHVFASSDRPTVIYGHNQKLVFSNVNLREVSYMCSFNTEALVDGLAIATENSLVLGTMDDIQKLHIRTIPLGEQPRRISYHESSQTFVVGTVRFTKTSTGTTEKNVLRLLDGKSWDFVHELVLEESEHIGAMTTCKFDDIEYIVVGTAFVLGSEDEPSKGRVLVYEIKSEKMVLACQIQVKGAVYCMTSFANGKLLAGVNSRVFLWKWGEASDGNKELIQEATVHNNVIALTIQTRGDFILVGDLMKSMTVYVYKPVDGVLEEIARDYNAQWLTATEILDDDTFIASENNYNFFTAKKNADAATEEERRKLLIVGQFHLGDFVNRFRHGSIVMKMSDTEVPVVSNSLVYGTVSGAVGIIGQITAERFAFFTRLQTAMTQVVKGVGGFTHEFWRSFNTERKRETAKGFIDGDLIETFLDLSKSKMLEVVQHLKAQGEKQFVTVEDVTRRIEEISAALH